MHPIHAHNIGRCQPATMPRDHASAAIYAGRTILKRRLLPIAVAIAIAVTAAIALLFTINNTPLQAGPVAAPQQQTGLCQGVTSVPAVECEALISLFDATNGNSWLDNTNWRNLASPDAPCDWAGVLCAGGHVRRLNLANNRLQGRLPVAIGAFSGLTHLNLSTNRLAGQLPTSICLLADTITNANFAFNQLTTFNQRVRTCMAQMDSDWIATQTIAPLQLSVTAITTNALQLSWRAIPYQDDAGGYEISYSTTLTDSYIVHGVTADKSTTSYLLDGLLPGQAYRVRVRTQTPAHLDQPFDQRSDYAEAAAVTLSPENVVLVIIYFAADNDLSPYIDDVLARIRRGTTLNPNVRVVFLADALGEHNTKVMEVASGVLSPTNAVVESWGVDELNTVDPAVLAWFLRYARERYPNAAHEIVSVLGHGIGLMPEIDWPISPTTEQNNGNGQGDISDVIPALPRGAEATPGDVGNASGYLSTIDIGVALAEATDNGANPFDILFFDQCFQGSFDVLYQVKDYADIIIASPNYAYLIAAYHSYLVAFMPTATPETMAQSVIRLYQNSLGEGHPNAIFWMQRSQIEQIALALNDLAAALRNAIAGGAGDNIGSAANLAQYVDTTQCGRQQFKLQPPDELLGAGRFASNLTRAFPTGDAFGINQAATALLAQLQSVSQLSKVGHPYLAPQEFWNYDDIFTLLAPLNADAPANVAWRASIYRPASAQEPISATWTPDPSLSLTISTTFDFVRDGQWDEFIAEWYNTPLPPTIGEWCHYTPPPLVTRDGTESLALDILVEGEQLQLTWTATQADDANSYWILGREQDAIGWVVLTTRPLTTTALTVQAPPPGAVQTFTVLAQDELGDTLAQSNQVSVGMPFGRQQYLPVIQFR